jgi:hypothetical protein
MSRDSRTSSRHAVPAVGFRSLAFAAVVVMAGACLPSTNVSDTWSAARPHSGPLRNVLIFAGGVDGDSRHSVEDAMALELTKRGVTASASYAFFGESLPSRDDGIGKIKSTGFDGVLSVAMRRHGNVPEFYDSGIWDYLKSTNLCRLPARESPYYTQLDETVDFETALWDLRTGRLLWSAVAQVKTPSPGEGAVVTSLSKTVVPALAKRGLIPGRPQG